jgi:beta-lactamase regulating signal transducer with metallopeptidase domain
MHTLALVVAGTTCFFALWLAGCVLSCGVTRLWLVTSSGQSAARLARALLYAILLPLLVAVSLAAHATWTAGRCSLVEQEFGLVGPCAHATRHLCAHVSNAMARLTQGAAWGGFALVVLLAGVVGLIVACSLVQWRRRRSRWTLLPPSRKLRAAMTHANTHKGLDYRETSDDIPGAVLVGWLKPRCLVAQSLVKSATLAELRMVLRHEIAHAVRRDNLTRAMVSVCRKILFFFPPAQWLCREWEKYVEFACDDAAVRKPQDALHLASALVKVCRSSAQRAAQATALIGEWSTVEQRVRRLVRWSHAQNLPSTVSSLSSILHSPFSILLLLCTALLLAALGWTLAAALGLSLHCAVETLARLTSG